MNLGMIATGHLILSAINGLVFDLWRVSPARWKTGRKAAW